VRETCQIRRAHSIAGHGVTDRTPRGIGRIYCELRLGWADAVAAVRRGFGDLRPYERATVDADTGCMFQRDVPRSAVAVAGRMGPLWRLLVECSDDVARISDFTAFRDAGFEIMLCEGPVDDAVECPVVRGAVCPFVAEADVVLFDGDRPYRSEVLAGIRASRPDLPVVVRSAIPAPALPSGCTSIQTTTSVHGQVSALRKAIDRRLTG